MGKKISYLYIVLILGLFFQLVGQYLAYHYVGISFAEFFNFKWITVPYCLKILLTLLFIYGTYLTLKNIEKIEFNIHTDIFNKILLILALVFLFAAGVFFLGAMAMGYSSYTEIFINIFKNPIILFLFCLNMLSPGMSLIFSIFYKSQKLVLIGFQLITICQIIFLCILLISYGGPFNSYMFVLSLFMLTLISLLLYSTYLVKKNNKQLKLKFKTLSLNRFILYFILVFPLIKTICTFVAFDFDFDFVMKLLSDEFDIYLTLIRSGPTNINFLVEFTILICLIVALRYTYKVNDL